MGLPDRNAKSNLAMFQELRKLQAENQRLVEEVADLKERSAKLNSEIHELKKELVRLLRFKPRPRKERRGS